MQATERPVDGRAFRAALLLAVAVAVLLLTVHSNRFVPTNDEGIILEPAQRLAAGESPYVDFFGYMTPGSYWIQAAVFRVLGVSLLTGRLPVILDFAIQCGLVLWIVARLATLRAGVITAVLFLGFQIADPSFITTQHRWDSGTLALAGACLAWEARAGSIPLSASAGALLAASAWCTPSMAPALAIACVWFAWLRCWRGLSGAASGATAVCIAALAVLVAEGSLSGFLQQLLWLKQNYSAVNAIPYGSVIGGYARIFENVSGPAVVITAAVVFCVALPAVLPPMAPVLWAFVHHRRRLPNGDWKLLALLLPIMAAVVATAFPRADIMHLAFVAALPAALCGAGVSRLFPARAAGLTCVFLSLGALAFASNYFRSYAGSIRLDSPVGPLLLDRDQAEGLRQILARVKPGDALFVHPYMPVLYFATQARNATRYSYLAPGLMTAREEREALASLRHAPPRWVLFQPTTREEFLRVFPHGTALDHRFRLIDSFLDERYEPAEGPDVQFAGYRLLQRKLPLAHTVLPRP